MELFIRLKDGQPIDHPIMGTNFRQAFPDVDIENLPDSFARFERVPNPEIGVYEVYEGVTYERRNGVITDVHHVRPMTQKERTEKQNRVKQQWADAQGYASWLFDVKTCAFVAPVPYPDDGLHYRWDEKARSWIAS